MGELGPANQHIDHVICAPSDGKIAIPPPILEVITGLIDVPKGRIYHQNTPELKDDFDVAAIAERILEKQPRSLSLVIAPGRTHGGFENLVMQLYEKVLTRTHGAQEAKAILEKLRRRLMKIQDLWVEADDIFPDDLEDEIARMAGEIVRDTEKLPISVEAAVKARFLIVAHTGGSSYYRAYRVAAHPDLGLIDDAISTAAGMPHPEVIVSKIRDALLRRGLC